MLSIFYLLGAPTEFVSQKISKTNVDIKSCKICPCNKGNWMLLPV